MKSGTGDDPFADTDDSGTEEAESTSTEPLESDGPLVESSSEPDREPEQSTDEDATASPDIPYKFRRDSVKDDRKQRPIFLRPDVEGRESEFIRTLEDELGEDVYKTDALEAALVVAMDNPDLVADELREWGYDWE